MSESINVTCHAKVTGHNTDITDKIGPEQNQTEHFIFNTEVREFFQF